MGHDAAAPLCSRRRWRLLGALLLTGGALLGARCSFTLPCASRGSAPLANGLQKVAARERGARTQMHLGPGGGADPVNNVSPEMAAQGQKYAEKYETIFLAGQKLWNSMKKADAASKKIYFIGTNGNQGDEVAEAVCDSLAYIPAPDGTFFIHRKPGVNYPKIRYSLWQSDKKLAERSKISSVDLYMEDEDKYRQLEAEVIEEFANQEFDGYPSAIVVGEGALEIESNVALMKKGLVVWLDADPEYTWAKTQHRPKQGGGLYVSPDLQQRPPVWAIANGWDGDIDDTEGKMEYVKFLDKRRGKYEEVADIRIRTDVPGIAENSYWGAGRIVKALNEYLGYKDDDGEQGVEEEVMEKDLEKFLEGARLSKYLKPALKWCEEQGAASIEDIVENVPDFSEAMGLKPLERKRLEKAAATVAVS